jgi:integrase/recombinase XerD
MLIQFVQSYLDVRRACGFELKTEGHLLCSFATFADGRNSAYVRADTAIEWAGLANLAQQRARRLGVVIRFARYMRAEDPKHELPPPIFGRETRTRPTPYILSKDEIQRLIRAASEAGYVTLRRDTYATLFALLACTGLRVSEAIALRFDDITVDGLMIRRTKFRKSRIVPVHDTTLAGLERYLERRRPYAPFDDHVFISLRRKPLLIEDVESAFRTAAREIGLPQGHGLPHATPHSLRHTFAVRSLEACPVDRDHVTKHTLALSTYLGHASVANTYWYLQATPDLMQDIAHLSERFISGELS